MKSYHVNGVLVIGYAVLGMTYWDGTRGGIVVAALCGIGALSLATAAQREWLREQREKRED